jgi:hypothetical protein
VNTAVSRLGGIVAVAMVGLVVTLVFASHHTGGTSNPFDRSRGRAHVSATRDAFRAGMLLSALLAASGGLIAGLGISNTQARAEADPGAGATAP